MRYLVLLITVSPLLEQQVADDSQDDDNEQNGHADTCDSDGKSPYM